MITNPPVFATIRSVKKGAWAPASPNKSMARTIAAISLLTFVLFFVSCQQYTENLKQSNTRADEAVAVSALRSISLAQNTTFAQTGKFATFPELVQSEALNPRFNADQPKLNGYVLTMTISGETYNVVADPAPPLTGRHFYLDHTGVIHANDSQTAGEADPPYQP
jgi:hypothetical protein